MTLVKLVHAFESLLVLRHLQVLGVCKDFPSGELPGKEREADRESVGKKTYKNERACR